MILQRLFPERKEIDPEHYRRHLLGLNLMLLPWAGGLALVAWLPYIVVDVQLYAEHGPWLLLLRSGLSLVGILLIVFYFIKPLQKLAPVWMAVLAIYLVVVTPLITNLVENDPRYVSGYQLVLILMAFVPLTFWAVLSLLLTSIGIYFVLAFFMHPELFGPSYEYVLLNVIVALVVTVAMHYANERIRLGLILRENHLSATRRSLRSRNLQMLREMHMARRVQRKLLPASFPVNEHLETAGYYRSIEQVGGDFFEIEQLSEYSGDPDDHRMLIVIADASGHGVPAALIASMAKASFRNALRKRIFKPHLILQDANRDLLDYLLDDHYLTAYIMLIDPDDGMMYFSNASHRPAILVRPGRVDAGMEQLDSHGALLGMFEDATFETRGMPLESEARLFFYTDGIVESLNARGEEYGLDRLYFKLREMRSFDLNASINAIFSDLRRFIDTVEPVDDIAMLMCRIKSFTVSGHEHVLDSIPAPITEMRGSMSEELRLLFRNQNWDAAIQLIKARLEQTPHRSALWYNLSLLYERRGDHELAREAINTAVDLKEREARRMQERRRLLEERSGQQ
ncbi:MAG: SpoIIE family protein phosphatase [Leptospiraceae bacterium]|nr:SpoIIE family protein phosphatase [Leptospiraceae bacterium]